jgi:hypothetical protein
MEPRSARILVLTGCWLSLIFLALALFVHNRLYDRDLERIAALEEAVVTLFESGAQPPSDAPVPIGFDAIQMALAEQAAIDAFDAAGLYDAAELKAFVAASLRKPFDAAPEARSLVPPSQVLADYGSGVVSLGWDSGSVNRILAATLVAQDAALRLGFRIYRSIDGNAPELIETVPFGVETWRDNHLPLAATRLGYEVWAVLLRSGPGGEVLVGAERSEMVTVATPEHFRLSLVGGNAEEAVLEVEVELPSAAGIATVTVQPGEALTVGGHPTGLVLQSIDQTREERLGTRRRILLTSDGSLILDPTTHEPRTTQTQVLVPVTRLVATLVRKDGEARTLDVDLP